MKRKFLLTSLMAGMSILPMAADDPPTNDTGTSNGPSQTPTQIPVYPVPINPNVQPQSLTENHIDCWYDGENLTFNFSKPEGNCNLTVTELEKGTVSWYRFDSTSEIVVYVGEIWNASICIDTSHGNSYEGFLGD